MLPSPGMRRYRRCRRRCCPHLACVGIVAAGADVALVDHETVIRWEDLLTRGRGPQSNLHTPGQSQASPQGILETF